MEIKKDGIDGGNGFDWGKTSADYAEYRDIYPQEFFHRIAERGLCVSGQSVLDVGTGTGVLPRGMYRYGACFTGIDIDDSQIRHARSLAARLGQSTDYITSSVEEADFPDKSFDVITACQCFIYFDYSKAAPVMSRLLKDNGRLVFLWMAWLPFEDGIAMESENLILKHNPRWTGCRARICPIELPDIVYRFFDKEFSEEYRLPVHFTRDSWHGRVKACRGTGASMPPEVLARWEEEHKAFLAAQPEEFDIAHYAAVLILRKKTPVI